MKLLQGKTVIITGATRGIGKGIAEKFADHGANIAFTYSSSEEKAREVENILSRKGVRAKAHKSDASSYTASEELINAVLKDFGNLEVLVNNAGITRDGLLMRMSEDHWNEVMNTNLRSVFNLTKAAIRTFLKNKSGSIINLSSVVGIRGNAGQANYSASKAGIIGFTKSVALELGSRNIRCNAIAPGFIETEMTASLDQAVVDGWRNSIPLKRGGTTEDVANLALFLACEWSSYITGQVINVDGGMLT